MDPTKADLESSIRLNRARLDRKLWRLDRRVQMVKASSKRIGIITGATVLAMTVLGTIALIARAILAARRRRPLGLLEAAWGRR